LALIVAPYLVHFCSPSSTEWLYTYSTSLQSILVRPHQSLAHLEEARAVRALSVSSSSSSPTPSNFSGFYRANDAVRIPPLVLAVFSPLLELASASTSASASDCDCRRFKQLLVSILLLLIDFSIAYLLEQIGIRLLLGGFRSSKSKSSDNEKTNDNNNDNNNDNDTIEEEDLQRILPESIRPPYSHIFPIYRNRNQTKTKTNAHCTSGGLPNKEEESKNLTQREEDEEPEPLLSMASLPLLSAQLYYWSPFTALPACVYSCWQNIPTLFLLASVYESVCYCDRRRRRRRRSSSTTSAAGNSGSLSMASFHLAAAAYLEPHHVIYVVPILFLSSVHRYDFAHQSKNKLTGNSTTSSMVKPAVFFVFCFVLWSLLLQGISYGLVGPSNYRKVLGTIYGNTWLTISPNLSLQWYFRIQTFARFRDYFGAAFAGIPLVLIGPVYLRFQRYPAVQIASWAMIWTIYRPVQVLFDANLAFCLLLFCPQSLARMGYASVVSLCCMPVPLLLNVVDHWMWLDANNGNANYMYFQCVAYNVFLGTVAAQFANASMHRDKALRLVYKKEVGAKHADTDAKLVPGN